MIRLFLTVLSIGCLVAGCSESAQTIQVEKFMGDGRSNLEPGDAAGTESESSEPEDDDFGAPDTGSNASTLDCLDGWVSDGWCDIQNNREECSFDGGDCCPSTCEDGEYLCGDYQWICIDPNACETTGECEPAPDNLELTYEEFCESYPEYCDDINDCEQFPELCDPEMYCEMYPDHCITFEEYCAMYPEDPICEAGDEGFTGGPGSNGLDANGCVAGWVGDGWCDDINNTAACGWDEGDCCPSTCVPGEFNCNEAFFHCVDPAACETTGEEPCEPPPSQFCITNPEYCAYYECLGQPDANPQDCYESAWGCEDNPEYCEE